MKALFWRRPRGFKHAKLHAERDALLVLCVLVSSEVALTHWESERLSEICFDGRHRRQQPLYSNALRRQLGGAGRGSRSCSEFDSFPVVQPCRKVSGWDETSAAAQDLPSVANITGKWRAAI